MNTPDNMSFNTAVDTSVETAVAIKFAATAPEHARLAFIGAGRLASGLALAFAAGGLKVSAVASRSAASAGAFAGRIAGCHVMNGQQAADCADVVFITTPDDAIAAVTAGLRWRAGQAVVHCSGVTEVAALSPAAAAGALTGGFHPMQAFTDPQAALASLPGCTISIEAADMALTQLLESIAGRIGCRSIRLPPGCRARYHASGGYAAQFVNVLLREATDIWRTFGVAEEDAVRALLPLLRGTLSSIEHGGVAGGMPGPVSRGDAGTIRRHVEDLHKVGDATLDFYCELARRTVSLAVEQGLSPEKVGELRAILTHKR